jgi:hypothetical protein
MLPGGNLLRISLQSDVLSIELVNAGTGKHVDFLIYQHEIGDPCLTGHRTLAGGMHISTNPDTCSAQRFVADEGTACATSPGAGNN